MLSGLTTEQNLLCLFSRPELGEAERELARHLLDRNVDWPAFTNLLVEHGIHALADRHIERHFGDRVPKESRQRLRSFTRMNKWIVGALNGELVAIFDAFAAVGIRAVPIKGPVLIERIWGDSALAAYKDLDLLVSLEDSVRAVDVLGRLGFRCETELLPNLADPEVRLDSDIELRRMHEKDFPIRIDLQFNPAPFWIGRPEQAMGIWNELEPDDYLGTPTWRFPDDFLLVYLALHALGHCFASLRWAAEVVGLLRLRGDLWPHALARAERIGAVREVEMARRVSETILSPEIVDRREFRGFERRLVEGPFREVSRMLVLQRIQLALRPTWVEKALYVLGLPFVPRAKDYAFVRLPRLLRPLYCAVRPLRLGYLGFLRALTVGRAMVGRCRRENFARAKPTNG